MKFKVTTLIISAIVAITSWGISATPEQVGTYSGWLKLSDYGISNGTKAKDKVPLLLTINANDTWSLGINGGTLDGGPAAIGPSKAFLANQSGAYTVTCSLHFGKDGIIKGVFFQGNNLFYGYFSEGKFTLKKQP